MLYCTLKRYYDVMIFRMKHNCHVSQRRQKTGLVPALLFYLQTSKWCCVCVDTRDRRFPETIGSLEGITEPDTAASCVDVFSTGPFDSDGSEFAQKTYSQSQPSGDAARDREVQPERTGSIQGSQARAEETRRVWVTKRMLMYWKNLVTIVKYLRIPFAGLSLAMKFSSE